MSGLSNSNLFRMVQSRILEGVFAINKPTGMSSAQVIRDCQSRFNTSALFKSLQDEERAVRARELRYQRKRRGQAKKDLNVKIGHGGTLDPLASGVLILGVGRGTKSLPEFLGCTKTYETVVLFGASTDTYDRVGKIIKKGSYGEVTRSAVEKALDKFRGKHRQIPPLYSALKMDGKPLYEYAREGKPIPRKIETRDVEVAELELLEWYEPGTHTHRWPSEEAEPSEKNLVDSVWQVAGAQAESFDMPPAPRQERGLNKEKESGSNKRKEQKEADCEERSSKRVKVEGGTEEAAEQKPAMSGTITKPSLKPGKGSNLIPPPPPPDTPLPWTGKGPPAAKLRLTVTSGFYVRSLCHDLGEQLQSGALMAELCRTRQGDFVLGENCLEYDDLTKDEDIWGLRVDRLLTDWMRRKELRPRMYNAPGLDADKDRADPSTAEACTKAVAGSETCGKSEIKIGAEPETDVEIQESEPQGDKGDGGRHNPDARVQASSDHCDSQAHQEEGRPSGSGHSGEG